MIIPFNKFFNEIFKENMTVDGVFGNTPQPTGSASQTTYNYAEGDTRIPKVLGSKSKKSKKNGKKSKKSAKFEYFRR